MAVDKNKIIAEATRLVQKGQYDKALKAYEKILAEDRKEVRTLLKVGEIHQKKGDNGAAAATFNLVAEIYGDQGFFLKAVAVYKQIAKLTPEDVRVNEKLAGLYQQLGLLNDATSQLQVVATAHEKTGDQGKHLDVLRRLLDLDPENVVTCQRLGSLYAKAGRNAEALELYRRAATHLRENRRGDEYLKLAERIYQLTPDDVKLARELAQEYLARGDTKKALGKLQACHGADKQDVDTLRLMAQAFRDLGQVSKTIAVYRALARVYAERGRRDEAALTWRLVLDLLPDDPEASEELSTAGGPRVATAAPPPGRPPGVTPAVMPVPTPPPVRAVTPPRAAPPPGIGRPASPAPAAPQAVAPPAGASPIARLLTETDVYLKYGLHQKALEHAQKILATDAENPDGLERLRDIRDAMGDREGAAEAAERAVQALLARGGEGRIEHAIERLRVLDPAHAEVRVEAHAPARDVQVEGEPVAGPASAPVVDELPLPDDEPLADLAPQPALATGAPATGVAEVDSPVATFDLVPPEPELVPPESELQRERDLIPPEDQGPAPVVEDERPILVLDDLPPPEPALPVAEEPPARPVEEIRLDDEAPPEEGAPLLEVEIAPAELEEPRAPAPVEVAEALPEEVDVADLEEVQAEEVQADDVLAEDAPVPPPLPERAPPSLEAELDEIQFYERQGLLDEAVLAVRDLAAAHPGHPEIERARARIEGLLGQAAPAAPEVEPAPPPQPEAYGSTGTTGIFDLGAELSAELGPELTPTPTGEFQYSVADVFDQFKRGLEKTVRPDDSATKYDLGIAFQEMGMLDEALEQFRSALAGGDRRREVEILNMIGVCLGMKGEHREAIEAYRQALRSEFLNGEAARALHFELGAAHEALGEPQVALWYFQKIAHGDPGYRGSGERVARLGGGPGTPPDGAGQEAPVPGGGEAGAGSESPAWHPGRKNAGSR